MARIFLFSLALSLSLITASRVVAEAGNHSPGKIAQDYNKEWPKGLSDLINSRDWLSGHWVNQGDFFYYGGDAAALNKFLVSYGKLPDTPLVVVLHAGAKPLTGPLGGNGKTAVDWELEVIRRGWGAPIDPRRPEKKPGYVVKVHVWLGDAITVDRLEVPKHVEVQSAGEIEQFIEHHRNSAR